MVINNQEHLKNICRLGCEAFTCSYLAVGSGGFECLKGTGLEKIIVQRRAQKSMSTLGDNCSGPPNFEVKKETVN